jgi:type II secretory pathway pseudopilin PulG
MRFAATVQCRRARRAFTLIEVVVALGVSVLLVAGVLSSFVLSARRAEWSAHSLAAQSLAQQAVEQTRAAKWDPLAAPPADEVVTARFPDVTHVLDIPQSGTNSTLATVSVTITVVSASPPLKQVRADCAWPLLGRMFTNTVITYRAPDQ